MSDRPSDHSGPPNPQIRGSSMQHPGSNGGILEQIELFAPNGQAIVGALAIDGSVRPFKYSYDRRRTLSQYVLEDGSPLPDGATTLVDAQGGHWSSTDVEWYTLFERR